MRHHYEKSLTPEQYQYASGLTPKGRIEIKGWKMQLLYWLLKPSKKHKKI